MLLSNYESIIFDLDGVLWQSNAAHENAYRLTFNEFGLKFSGYENLAGRRTDEVFKGILERLYGYADQDLINKLVKTKRGYASIQLKKNPFLSCGCNELLNKLSVTHRLVLASSSSKDNINIFLEVIDNPKCFEIVISGEDVSKAKPSPEIYELAHKKLLISKSKCLIVEDSTHGIEAANKAGIECVAIVGTHDSSKLLNARPSFIINSLEELLYFAK